MYNFYILSNSLYFYLFIKDKVDDLLLGIKSTALRFGDNTKLWLTGFSAAMCTSLVTTGLVCEQSWPYYTMIGLVGAHLAQQIYSLNINNPSDCAKKFISNHQVGLLIFIGIILGTLCQKSEQSKSSAATKLSSSSLNFSSLNSKGKELMQNR